MCYCNNKKNMFPQQVATCFIISVLVLLSMYQKLHIYLKKSDDWSIINRPAGSNKQISVPLKIQKNWMNLPLYLNKKFDHHSYWLIGSRPSPQPVPRINEAFVFITKCLLVRKHVWGIFSNNNNKSVTTAAKSNASAVACDHKVWSEILLVFLKVNYKQV